MPGNGRQKLQSRQQRIVAGSDPPEQPEAHAGQDTRKTPEPRPNTPDKTPRSRFKHAIEVPRHAPTPRKTCQAPPKPATHTESPRKHAPKRNGTRPDTSFTGAVRVERGAGIDTEALEKEPGFLMAPQLRKMLRPPRPESHCGPLQDTACKNMPPTDGRTPGKDAAASNGGGRQNAPPNDHGSPRRCHNHDVPHPRLSMPPHTRHRLQRYAAQPKAGQPRCRNLKQGYSGPPRSRSPQCAAPQQPPRLPRPTSPSDDAQPTKPPPPNTAKYPLNPASGDNAAQHRYRSPMRSVYRI